MMEAAVIGIRLSRDSAKAYDDSQVWNLSVFCKYFCRRNILVTHLCPQHLLMNYMAVVGITVDENVFIFLQSPFKRASSDNFLAEKKFSLFNGEQTKEFKIFLKNASISFEIKG